jgi:hypothetical protein
MELAAILLPVMAFVALVAGLVVVFRGTTRIAARTREVEQFRRRVKDLAVRIDGSIETAASRIDAVRHQQASPEVISPAVAVATEAIDGYCTEARALRGPEPTQPIRDDLVADLERAHRALGMVEHGASLLATARHGSRDLEAQTSIKRGYLNLIHAREAIARQALRADHLEQDQPPRARTRFGV